MANSDHISKNISTLIVERAIRYIYKTPPAISGENGSSQTFNLAQHLIHDFALSGEVVHSLLATHYNPRCDPQWSDKELRHKVNEAIKHPPTNTSHGCKLPPSECNQVRPARLPIRKVKAPRIDPVNALANVDKFLNGFRCTEEEIIAASPYKLPPLIRGEHFYRQGAYLISMMYDRDDLVNIVGDSKQNDKGTWHPVGYGETLPRNECLKRLLDPLPNRPGGCWMRMNPMDGKGITDNNLTAFRFSLLEFDDIPLEHQLSLFAKLPLPIVTIIHSGGRSYHAWIQVNASSLDEYKDSVSKIYDRMGRFGVDRNNKNASRMSRLPGVYRGDQLQRLVYLNAEPSTGGIL
jgi:hypothetical protein